jgi:hypothetical protein
MSPSGRKYTTINYSIIFKEYSKMAKGTQNQEEIELSSLSNSEAQRGQFGIKTALDMLKLTQTKEWSELIRVIEEKRTENFIAKIIEREEQLQKMMKEALFNKSDEEKKEDRARSDMEIALQQAQAAAPPKPAKPPESVRSTEEYNTDLENLTKEIAASEEQYKGYKKSIKEADEDIQHIEAHKNTHNWSSSKTIQVIDSKIAKLESGLQNDWEKVNKLMENEDYEGANKELAKIKSQTVYIGSLKDMLAVTKGDKNMYKNDGSIATKFEDAAFIVPKGQRVEYNLATKEHFLLNKGEVLTAGNREAAKEAFENDKPKLSSVRDVIDNNHEMTSREFAGRMAGIVGQIKNLQAKNVSLLSKPSDTSTPQSALQASHIELGPERDQKTNSVDESGQYQLTKPGLN